MAKMSSISPAAVVLGAALSAPNAALAEPVAKADLAGKKICWNTGNTAAYHKDGSLDSSRFGHGTWRLASDTLTISAEHGSFAFTIKKEGGAFHAIQGGSEVASGNYCN